MKDQPRVEPGVAVSIAREICQDLCEGNVPGCEKCLSADNMDMARAYIALVVCQYLRENHED